MEAPDVVATPPTPGALVFSDAEVTLLAFTLDKPYFPATLPPTLDGLGWDAVERALVARGVMHGRFRKRVAEDVEAVLDVMLSADRSLWPCISYPPGEGQSSAYVLWCKDDAVVRQVLTPDGMQHINVCDATAVEATLASLLDPLAGVDSQPGPPVSLPLGEYATAVGICAREGPDAAARRFPAAAESVIALAAGRCSTSIETRVPLGDDIFLCEMVTVTQSPEHGLWLAHDEPHSDDRVTGVVTRVQRVSFEMAREAITTLVRGAG